MSLARVEGLPLRLLGRHELGRAEHHALLREDDRPGRISRSVTLASPKSSTFGKSLKPALVDKKDVFGLEIAMHDARAVRFFERAAHLNRESESRAPPASAPRLAHGLVEVRPSRYSITM